MANWDMMDVKVTLQSRLHVVHAVAPTSKVEGRYRAAGTDGLDATIASEEECCCMEMVVRLSCPCPWRLQQEAWCDKKEQV
jgi:hypothetical protein